MGCYRADLVVEIVSPDDPARDLTVKRADYAAAGVLEYWVVDPRRTAVMVLRLAGAEAGYVEHGVSGPGSQATSWLLDGFGVDVDALFAARPSTAP